MGVGRVTFTMFSVGLGHQVMAAEVASNEVTLYLISGIVGLLPSLPLRGLRFNPHHSVVFVMGYFHCINAVCLMHLYTICAKKRLIDLYNTREF